ncbi:type II secretion system protein N [Thalassotalea piscium]
MKKWLAVGAAFLSVYLIFVIVLLPARYVINKIQLPKNVQIAGISGSIWHSKIDSLLIEKTLINHISIKVNWSSLFLLNPSVEVAFGGALYNGPEGRFNALGFLSDITISDLQLEISANEIAQQLPLPIPMQAKDNVVISVKEFVLGQPVCQQLSGQIQWKNAAIIALSEQVPLGTLKAALSCEKGNAVAVLDDNNDLGVTFSAVLGNNGVISGNGYLTPHNQLPKAIEQVLPFLGRKDNQGRYRLAF